MNEHHLFQKAFTSGVKFILDFSQNNSDATTSDVLNAVFTRCWADEPLPLWNASVPLESLLPSVKYCADIIIKNARAFYHFDWTVDMVHGSEYPVVKVLLALGLDLVYPLCSHAEKVDQQKHRSVKAEVIREFTSSNATFSVFTPARQVHLRAKYGCPSDEYIDAVNSLSFVLSPTGNLLCLNVETGAFKPVLDCICCTARGGVVNLDNSQLLQPGEHGLKGTEHGALTDVSILGAAGVTITIQQLAVALWRQAPPPHYSNESWQRLTGIALSNGAPLRAGSRKRKQEHAKRSRPKPGHLHHFRTVFRTMHAADLGKEGEGGAPDVVASYVSAMTQMEQQQDESRSRDVEVEAAAAAQKTSTEQAAAAAAAAAAV